MVTALLVTNITYADYLVASVVGHIYKLPVYTVYQDPVNISNTVQMLISDNVTNVIIIGGPAVISNLLLQNLNQSNISYLWIWGTRRYDTSAYVALYFWNSSNSAVLITRDLVNEHVSPDKLPLVTNAVQYAKENDVPILIVPNGVLSESTLYALKKLNVTKVVIFTGASPSLGNITDQLNSLNISYEVYSTNRPPLHCVGYIYVNITPNTSWHEIREIFIGKVRDICILPIVVNNNINITQEREKLKQEIENEYKMYRKNVLNLTEIVEKRINRLLERQILLLDKFELLCNYTNNRLPVCNILPQLNQTLTLTIQEAMNGNISALINNQNKLENYNWEVIRNIGDYNEREFIKNNMDYFKRKMDLIEDKRRSPIP
ncbi:MAG: cell wall-binding repeat-containing protein [Candidatus Nanopusillus sp.]